MQVSEHYANGEENSNEMDSTISLFGYQKKSFDSNYSNGFSPANSRFVLLLSIFIFSKQILFFILRFICMVDFKNQDQIKYATDEATENITNELKGTKKNSITSAIVMLYMFYRYT